MNLAFRRQSKLQSAFTDAFNTLMPQADAVTQLRRVSRFTDELSTPIQDLAADFAAAVAELNGAIEWETWGAARAADIVFQAVDGGDEDPGGAPPGQVQNMRDWADAQGFPGPMNAPFSNVLEWTTQQTIV
jgi:hypothetical protein